MDENSGDFHGMQERHWDKKARGYERSESRWQRRSFDRFYKKYKDRLQGPYLDIACGTGRFLKQLASDGKTDIYGFDLSSEMVQISRENLLPFLGGETETRILKMNMLEIRSRYPPGFFNTVIFSRALQQLKKSEARPMIEGVAAVAAPGALVYFSTRSLTGFEPTGPPVEGEVDTHYERNGEGRKSYYSRADIEMITDGLFDILELEEKLNSEAGTFMDWRGALGRK